eukprot:scaffold2437_cov111-Isochrysis_galbana.AAC.1
MGEGKGSVRTAKGQRVSRRDAAIGVAKAEQPRSIQGRCRGIGCVKCKMAHPGARERRPARPNKGLYKGIKAFWGQ